MFVLQNYAIADNDFANIVAFVCFWSQFYNNRIKVCGGPENIDYAAELNLGHNLTAENCRRLLRWKDPHQLTHVIQSGPNQGQPNPRVQRVLEILPNINSFRRGDSTENQFRDLTDNVFPNGLVWQIFLFHIARPHAYPIGDQHVFRAFRLHRHNQDPENWEFYQNYRAYFADIANACGVACEPANVVELKRIDSALMVFGRFLKKYYRP